MYRSVYLISWCLAAAAAPVVDLHGVGKLRGTLDMSGDVPVEAFLGVPYATAPVGTRRWQPPSRTQGWSGVRDATHFGNTCMGSQCKSDRWWREDADSEDCLYLNIYTPVAKDHHGGVGPWPVMFWIHGGAFDSGCSNLYDGQQLAARSAATGEPVVVVTINYRLNIFGFLGSDEMRPNATTTTSIGNYGIQDQRQALQFIHKHVAAFNGDPQRITIFGESAGAGSVTNHIVQKESYGWYRNAIAQSGFAPQWSSKPIANAERYYAKVKNFTACTDYACMQGLPTDAIMEAHKRIPALPVDRYISWAPVVDGVALKEAPEVLLSQGHFAPNITILKGTTRDEFALFTGLRNLTYNVTHAQFELNTAPYLPEKYKALWMAELTTLYSAGAYPYYPNSTEAAALNATHSYWALVRALTDHEFYCPGKKAGRNLAGDVSVSVFSYHLRHNVQYGGAVVPHVSDIPYVFNCSGAGGFGKAGGFCAFSSQPQQDLATTMSGYWISFANANTLPSPWTRIGCDLDDPMLVLDVGAAYGGDGIHIERGYAEPQCEFWSRVEAAMRGDVNAHPFTPRALPQPHRCP